MYNTYKYYVIANEYYNNVKKSYNKSQNYYSRGTAIKVDNEVVLRYNVPLHENSRMFRACEYIVEGNSSFTTGFKMPQPHHNNIDDPILSAMLYHQIDDNVSEKDITHELNSFLVNDKAFLYSNNMKKVYNKLLQCECNDIDKGDMWIEYIDSFDLTRKKLVNGHLIFNNIIQHNEISN